MSRAPAALQQGREAYSNKAWLTAYRSLSAADQGQRLGPGDLALLATSAYMLGREDEYLDVLERAYRLELDADHGLAALRHAFWIGVNRARRGEMGPASGWLGRAQRLLDREQDAQVERGYLLLPRVFEHEAGGDWAAASAVAAKSVAIGERFGDPDLVSLAGHEQGHALVRQGRVDDGMPLLDEAMVAASAGELSPIVTGIVYCGVILACQEAREVRRAREWTSVLTRWCEEQPDMVAFTGRCLIHRAEILQLEGAWTAALAEAQRAAARCLESENRGAAGEACYCQGEVHRLRGDLGAAEDAYRQASRLGHEPQPGLALLRVEQDNSAAAAAAISRALGETVEPGRRSALLPAYVEVMLVTGNLVAARHGADELDGLARSSQAGALGALAAQARGAVSLADGDARPALTALRHAAHRWQELSAPYEEARVRELIGRACRVLGDEDTAALELEAAHDAFRLVGATAAAARVGRSLGTADGDTHGLTGRELQVLRLAAAGCSNREIATELVLSEHTVARHLQNIFAKLGVSSRTAASSYALSHGLI